MELATLGNGCFWCTEAVFQRLKGVERVQSGYAGGEVKNPTYEQVCSGTTGHAEVLQISFNPKEISYHELLEVFWATHDPTTLNRQGNDVGTQYRSVIFYHSNEQHDLAIRSLRELEQAKIYPDPIVTQIGPITEFYPAENYHTDYFNKNGQQPYCNYVVRPKVDKFQKQFKTKLSEGEG